MPRWASRPGLLSLGTMAGGHAMGNVATLARRLIPIQAASDYTGLSKHTLYTMVSQRRIPYVKVGRRTMFDVGLLDEWFKQHTVMPMPERAP